MPPRSLSRLAGALRGAGHEPRIASLGWNVDCGEASVERVIAELDGPTAVVGHSRGGQLGLVAAVRRPDLVHTLVTVGTPWTIGPPDRRGVAVVARAVRAAQRRGIRVLPSIDCATDACCERFRADLREKPGARWIALWSSEDRVAGRDSVPPPHADERVDVGGGHLGLVRTARGIAAVRTALGR